MTQLTLQVPEPLARQLERLAAEQEKSVEQVALEQLTSALEPSAENLQRRYEGFLKQSGLFVEVSKGDRGRYQPVSEERLRELAARLGAAGPLSEVVIEERGKL